MYPAEYLYSKEHEWIRIEGTTGTIGITEFAQKELGDVVFVELPQVGRKLRRNESMGTVESVKAVSDIFCPVSGEVLEVNPALASGPELVNKDPHQAAWMIKLRVDNPEELKDLLSAEAYQAFVAASKH